MYGLLPPLAKLTLEITPALYPEQFNVIDEGSILPPVNAGNTFTLKLCIALQPVELDFNVNVKLKVPICQFGIVTEIGDTFKFASIIETNPGIVDVKLYWSGLPKINEYGTSKFIAE